MKRDALFNWIDDYLEIDRHGDYSPIGLQVEGSDDVEKVALGVSAHLALINDAASWGAQALLVHHGFFWPGESPVLKGWRKKRIKTLLDHDISLGGYHLPLDGHAEVGNNAQIADILGLPRHGRSPFARAKGAEIGLICRYDEARAAKTIFDLVETQFGPRCIIYDAGPEMVDTVAIVSGSAAGNFEEARSLGAQLFLTGEAREPTMAEAMETQSHFVAAGHYNTERVGIIALGEKIREVFGVEVCFFEHPNPV